MATVFLFIAAIAFSLKIITKLSTLDQSHQAHVKISLFWSIISVLQFTNLIELVIQVMMLTIFPSLSLMNTASESDVNDSSLFYSLKIIGIVKIIFEIFFCAFGAVLGVMCDKRCLPPNPKSRKMCGSSSSDIDHMKALGSIFLLVFFVSTSVITTAALLFVHPILVLSTVAYIVTSIFCMAAVFALPSSFGMIINKWKTHKNNNEFKRNCVYLCDCILYIIVIIVGNLLMLLFLTFVSSADNTYASDIFQDASSFLPSIILACIGYVAKKKLSAKSMEKQQITEDLNVRPDYKRTTTSLELVEEGRGAMNDSDNEFHDESNQEIVKLLPGVEDTEL